MSFGDQNNPYGAPQSQQPGYPQQGAPQQPGYGYPAAPPVNQAYGYPAGPMEMPGGVKAARVMMWVIAGLQVVGVAILFLAAAAVNKLKDDPNFQTSSAYDEFAKFSTGVIFGLVALAVAYMVASIVLAIQVGKGGNGVRVGIIVYASIGLALSLYPFFPLSIVHLVLLILVIVFVAKKDGAAWFQRPRG
ncbi:hypothetical protein ACWCP6_04340 [Streptomyces sp. NPDC002004]